MTQSFLMCCAAVLCSGYLALIAAGWSAVIAAGWLSRISNYFPDVNKGNLGKACTRTTSSSIASVLHTLASSRFELLRAFGWFRPWARAFGSFRPGAMHAFLHQTVRNAWISTYCSLKKNGLYCLGLGFVFYIKMHAKKKVTAPGLEPGFGEVYITMMRVSCDDHQSV